MASGGGADDSLADGAAAAAASVCALALAVRRVGRRLETSCWKDTGRSR